MFGTCKSAGQAVAIYAAVAFGVPEAARSATLPVTNILSGDLTSILPLPAPVISGLSEFSHTMAPRPQTPLLFPQLQVRSRQLMMSVSAVSGADFSYGVGGTVLCSTSPFRWKWNASTQGSVVFGFWRPKATVSLSLRLSASGAVHLIVDFRDASKVTAASIVPGNIVSVAYAPPADLAAVPVPGAGGLLAAGLGILALRNGMRRLRAALQG